MLDHDLGDRQMVDSTDENTGFAFCKWLVSKDFNRETVILIHSHNPCGANNMKDYLTECGYKNVFVLAFSDFVRMWINGQISICGRKISDKLT
jgi:hypothetical protein